MSQHCIDTGGGRGTDIKVGKTFGGPASEVAQAFAEAGAIHWGQPRSFQLSFMVRHFCVTQIDNDDTRRATSTAEQRNIHIAQRTAKSRQLVIQLFDSLGPSAAQRHRILPCRSGKFQSATINLARTPRELMFVCARNAWTLGP